MSVPKFLLFFLTFFIVGFTNAQSFYKTPSGKAYHLSSYRMVKNVSQEISATQARELGLQPCKICYPENIYGVANPPKPAAGQSTATVQCNGITAAGTRCKHKTSIANGYCYQHQPKN